MREILRKKFDDAPIFYSPKDFYPWTGKKYGRKIVERRRFKKTHNASKDVFED
jgi:hypothetical protein